MRGGENTKGLRELIEYLPENLTMIEVGSYAGESAVIFAETMAHITCIDAWTGYAEDAEEAFDNRIRDIPNITKIKARFEDVDLEPADFVYIDGEHDYESVRKDIDQWLPKARRFIGGHDYKEKFPGVMKAVDETFGEPKKVFSDSSWLCTL